MQMHLDYSESCALCLSYGNSAFSVAYDNLNNTFFLYLYGKKCIQMLFPHAAKVKRNFNHYYYNILHKSIAAPMAISIL